MPMIHPVIQLIPSLVHMIQKVGLNTILLTTDAVYMKCLNMTWIQLDTMLIFMMMLWSTMFAAKEKLLPLLEDSISRFSVFVQCMVNAWVFIWCLELRDPFSSLYAYLPKAHHELFYDVACSLNEYSLNRDPAYFRQTRFWHDLFHGFSHKCPLSLRSSCLPTFDELDTEICEQFNSFLQNIKSTATHFSKSFLPLPAVHGSYLELQGKWAMGKYQ